MAIAIGFAGPLVYAMQTLEYRKSAEDRELGNVAAIANAAREYAVKHGGMYPADIGVLLEERRITPMTLHSPYAGTPVAERVAMGEGDKSRGDFLKYVDGHSDYQYFGGDLRLNAGSEKTAADFAKIVIASGKEPIMRIHIAVGFADGRSDFVTLEDAEKVVKGANEGRARLGFAEMRPPESVEKAEHAENNIR